jgi:predicted acetylornithine/succinylornithine family transaminase
MTNESPTLPGCLDTAAIKHLAQEHILNTYGERKLAMVRGDGATLWDADGNEYLDFFAGIAVANLGHCHPAVTRAIAEQAATLVHVSNLYYIEPQAQLAKFLCEHTFAEKWFFCNSGAEANEAAIKLARRYWVQRNTPRPTIVTAEHSFHGRTLGALRATGQPKYHAGFEPLMEGFKHVPYDDVDAIEQALTPDVGAVLLEPVQGEGGVRVPKPDYLSKVRQVCDAKGILLILDEVQTGAGRTGRLFAHEHAGITPDIMTAAKALGNGVPIGAMGCTNDVATGFSVGSHASTFGGNPLCSAAALATLTTLIEGGHIEHAAETGAYFMDKLRDLETKHHVIREVRGLGLMIGIELNKSVVPVLDRMIASRIICGPAGPNVLRFVPPLIVTHEQVDRVVDALDEAVRSA